MQDCWLLAHDADRTHLMPCRLRVRVTYWRH